MPATPISDHFPVCCIFCLKTVKLGLNFHFWMSTFELFTDVLNSLTKELFWMDFHLTPLKICTILVTPIWHCHAELTYFLMSSVSMPLLRKPPWYKRNGPPFLLFLFFFVVVLFVLFFSLVFAAFALSLAEFLIEVGCGRVQYRHFVTGSRGGGGGGGVWKVWQRRQRTNGVICLCHDRSLGELHASGTARHSSFWHRPRLHFLLEVVTAIIYIYCLGHRGWGRNKRTMWRPRKDVDLGVYSLVRLVCVAVSAEMTAVRIWDI